ncbi:hypothetical protein FGO68_gene16939 [Halteria grandinella]|uniref:TFIIS central domain-containing protein n=1 Tax=Halteria grandinella TaxID=5974 RepID=A0A8J8P523_HALGN|nr:hypothetical protein FGO68_gene16939 [Halteria grandinella]
MTAPNQKIFNPNLFKAPAQEQESEPQENSGGGGKKDYPVSGNATRDQVRKLIFESFQGDNPSIPGEKLSISQAVEVIESSILNESKDPKSKQYRDKSRQVQLKLKGPRYEQSRNELRTGAITAEDFIKDEYVQGKAAATAAPNQMQQRVGSAPMMPPGGGGFAQRPPMMGGGGPRPMMPMGMMRPPGPGGPMVRPRMMAPPAFSAPRPQFMQTSLPTPIEERPQESSEKLEEGETIEQTPITQPIIQDSQLPIHSVKEKVQTRKQSQQSPETIQQPISQSEPKDDFGEERSAVTPFIPPAHQFDNSLNSSTIIQESIQTSIDDDEGSNLGYSQKKPKKMKKKKKKEGCLSRGKTSMKHPDINSTIRI